MHGRLKVKTTAQQQEEKEKERAKKLILYNAGIKKASEKRKNEDFDNEAFEITSQLLLANPDIYTMWNFRKEILQFKKKNFPSDFREVMVKELAFVENCLRVNHKSYGSWNHRIWVLNEMPEPDWQKEVHLCNKYLELDERNFHCWGYRFYVIPRAKVSPEQELEFSDSKINFNFSNYSSWHYRSKLLPLIYPDPDKLRPIEEGKLLQEFELVQNAAFTDPNDQSAWFYHRWLLGRGEMLPELIFLYINRDNSIIAVFNKPVQAAAVLEGMKILIESVAAETKWSHSAQSSNYSVQWIGEIIERNVIDDSVDCNILATFKHDGNISTLICLLENGKSETWVWKYQHWKNFCMELSTATTSVLQQELESCIQLQELEPGSKWPLLTNILLMRSLDFKQYKNQIMDNFEQIMRIDFLRAAYYKDLKSKFIVENAIENLVEKQCNLTLTDLNLTVLCHAEYLVHLKKLNLTNNHLQSLSGFGVLLCLETLIVDGNSIRNCNGLQSLPKLSELSMQANAISKCDELHPLTKCCNLKILDLQQNPVCGLNNHKEKIVALIPNLWKLNQNVLK